MTQAAASDNGIEATPSAASKRSLPRRLLRWTFRGFIAIVVLFILLLIAGFTWEQVASRAFHTKHPAPGELITLPDGRTMHFVVKGEGEPTLVLVAGAGGPYTDWNPVIDELAHTTRVIAYDRAGYGWSDPASATRSSLIIKDLHDGLEALGETGPFILVGHSIGGVYIRHYAATYPDQVAGLVLVDSSHEEQATRMPPAMIEMIRSREGMMKVVAFASRFGLLRALEAMNINPITHDGMGDAQRAMMCRSSTIRALKQEYGSVEISCNEAGAAAQPLGDLPVLILTATSPPQGVPPEFAELIDTITATWRELQSELAQRSTNTRHIFVKDAGHYIQFDQPHIVTDETIAMIDAVRNGEPLQPAPPQPTSDQSENDPDQH